MKRKAISILVVSMLLLSFVLPGTGAAANDYSYIKVKLVSIGSPSSITFVVKGAYRIAESSGTDLYPGITYTMKPAASGSGLQLSYSNGLNTVTVSLPATANFKQYTNGSANNYLYVNNPGYGWRNYSGDMQFTRPSGAGYLAMINTVFFETYLYGVIASEMSNSWPVEALKVQAVCARTYSLKYMKANYSNSYHIGDTSANQVYKGMPLNFDGTVQQNVVTAVDSTRGMIITIGNPANMTLADGVFSASNGGQIRTANMHWGSTNTYHVFKDDPYDLRNSSSPTFQYIFPANMASVSSLSVSDQEKVETMVALVKSALVSKLAAMGITCSENDIEISGFRAASPVKPVPGLPSGSHEYTKVSVTCSITVDVSTPTPTASPSPTPSPTPTPASTDGEPTIDPSATEQLPVTVSGGGASPALFMGDVTVELNYIKQASDGGWDAKGELKTAFAIYNSLINTGNMWNLYAEQSADGRFLYVVARGYGHGVGMSQRGAQQMAKEGKTYSDILNFYYNLDTTNAEMGAVAVTPRTLPQIPGKGAAAQYATVTVSSLNVRAAASASATSIGTLNQGTRVEILGVSGGWYRVLNAAKGMVGWASGKSGETVYILPDATPKPSPTASPTPSPTPSVTPSATESATATDTAAATDTGATGATPTPSPTSTPSATLNPGTVSGVANVSGYLSLRQTASSSARCLIKIPKNAKMTVLQVHTAASWLKVTYKGKTGYVMSRYVTVSGNKTYKAGTVTAQSLNVRSGAGTKYAVIGVVKSSNTLTITQSVKVTGGTWYKIICGGKSGYVDGRYIRKAS